MESQNAPKPPGRWRYRFTPTSAWSDPQTWTAPAPKRRYGVKKPKKISESQVEAPLTHRPNEIEDLNPHSATIRLVVRATESLPAQVPARSSRASLPKSNWLDRWLDKGLKIWPGYLLFWLYLFVLYCLVTPVPLPLSKLVEGLFTDVSLRVVFSAWLIIGLLYSSFSLLLFILMVRIVVFFNWAGFLTGLIAGSATGIVMVFVFSSTYQFLLINLSILIGSILKININSTIDLAIHFVNTSSIISFLVICTTLLANFILFGTLIKNFFQRRMQK